MNKFLIKGNRNSFNSGFAMLFTVLIVTLILSIAIGISSTTLKQTILSSLAKDSQISFYQADTAIECGMYYDTNDTFPVGTTPASVSSIVCGEGSFSINMAESYTDYLVFYQNTSSDSEPCSIIVFDKSTLSVSSQAIVQGFGYNVCQSTPRQVERALQVTYDL